MRAVTVVSALLMAACMAGVAVAASEQYPHPSFFRRISYLDSYTSAYCLENGEPGTQQGSAKSQRYEAVQACYVGQIRISRAGAIGQLTMDVGAIGGVGAALVELGSINNLTVEYGATSDPYVSIHLNVADNAFMISSDNSFVPIRNTAALKQTTTSAPLFPNKGSVYLARLTESPSTDEKFANSMLLAKILIVDFGEDYVQVRWDVIWSDRPYDGTEALTTASRALATGTTALIFVIFVIVGLGIAAAIKARKSGSAGFTKFDSGEQPKNEYGSM